jgi:hypothetical protein
MTARGRRILWICATAAIVLVTATASWWLISDLRTTDRSDTSALARQAARRVRTVERTGALAAPPGTTVTTTPSCGDSTLPAVEYTFINTSATTPVADALTEQLRADGWAVGELEDGFRDYRRMFTPWPARLGMTQKTADGNSVTLHLDVGAHPDTDCEAFLAELRRAPG